MKSTFTCLLLVFSSVFFLSCSSDDDAPAPPPPPTQAELIVGDWDMTSTTIEDGRATITSQIIPITVSITGEGRDYDYQLSFTEDDQVSEQGGFTLSLSISAAGISERQEIPFQVSDSGILLSGSYEIEENQLIVSNTNQTVSGTIDQLTETNLDLSVDLDALAPTLFPNDIQNVSGTLKLNFAKIQ